MAIEDYYGTLSVYSTAQVVDEFGDNVTALSEPRIIEGYIGHPSSAQVFLASQRGVEVGGILYAPVSCGVHAYDRVLDPFDGREFVVISEPRDAARRGHHVQAELKELRGVHDAD